MDSHLEGYHTITVPSSPTSLDMLDDITFADDEQATKPITEEVRLMWFNGLSTDTDFSAIGWHLKAGVNPYLDETVTGMGLPQYMVQHKRPDKDGVTRAKPYWRLRSCSLIVIAQRLQSPLEMNRSPDERLGLAYGWNPKTDQQKSQAHLKCRAFVHELVSHGYQEWFPLSLSGYITDSFLEALQEQYRVLEVYSDYKRGAGKNSVAPFYLFSMPTAPGTIKPVGKAPNQGTIYPIVAQIPAMIDRPYLEQHLIPRSILERIRGELLAQTMGWAADESKRIIQGHSEEDEPLPEEPITRALPAPASDDLQVQPAQIAWIERQYCQGNQETIQQLCAFYGVSSLSELRASHFRTLVAQRQGNRGK